MQLWRRDASMVAMAPSDLTSLPPLWVSNDQLPTPLVRENIDTLRKILDLVVEDWRGAVTPLQSQIDENPMVFTRVWAFDKIQPVFLKCLFSYAFFTVSLEGAYEKVFAQLSKAHNELRLKVKKPKKPNRTAAIVKISTIRDCSIAHFPSDRVSLIDAMAAMSWRPMALDSSSGKVDLEQLTFNPGRWRAKNQSTGEYVESRDLEVRGLVALHQDCSQYLDNYGRACADYLRALNEALPPKSGAWANR